MNICIWCENPDKHLFPLLTNSCSGSGKIQLEPAREKPAQREKPCTVTCVAQRLTKNLITTSGLVLEKKYSTFSTSAAELEANVFEQVGGRLLTSTCTGRHLFKVIYHSAKLIIVTSKLRRKGRGVSSIVGTGLESSSLQFSIKRETGLKSSIHLGQE